MGTRTAEHAGAPCAESSTRVLLVDDHAAVREGLTAFLARTADIEVVGEAATVLAAVSAVERLQPDLVLLDLGLPDLQGAKAVQALVEASPSTRILVLSGSGTGDTARACLRAGASGYLLKTSPASELSEAIRRVVDGGHAVDGSLAVQLAEVSQAALTDQELAVLEMVSQGMTNRRSATRLGVSEHTVKTHLASVMRKLGAGDRAHAVSIALRGGLLQ